MVFFSLSNISRGQVVIIHVPKEDKKCTHTHTAVYVQNLNIIQFEKLSKHIEFIGTFAKIVPTLLSNNYRRSNVYRLRRFFCLSKGHGAKPCTPTIRFHLLLRIKYKTYNENLYVYGVRSRILPPHSIPVRKIQCDPVVLNVHHHDDLICYASNILDRWRYLNTGEKPVTGIPWEILRLVRMTNGWTSVSLNI